MFHYYRLKNHSQLIASKHKKINVIHFIVHAVLLHCTNTTHTHTRLTALFPGLPGTRKAKPIWILLKQETVSGSGISWNICKSAPRSRQITTPAPHHSVFLQAGCPFCRPTNSVKALMPLPSKYNHACIVEPCTQIFPSRHSSN